jgi:SAM-dependent methyltransferase
VADPLRPSVDDAQQAWADRVRANREQVERFREEPDGADFYAPVATMFRADPHRRDEPALEVLRSLVRPGETVLDVGAGGGRYALPLSLVAREVIALDPSEGMLAVLREGMTAHGITNVRTFQGRWPDVAADLDLAADVALVAHVGYDIEAIGPFLDAMEAAARRLCVAVLLERQPTFAIDRLWPEVHGEERAALPSLPEFLVLLLARGRLFEVRLAERAPLSYPDPDEALALVRRQLWTRPGSARDMRARRLVEERMVERDGRYALSWEPLRIGVVSWAPPGCSVP